MSQGQDQGLGALREGQQAELVCLLADKRLLQTKAGKPFGSLVLSDGQGRMEAKLWERAPELLEPLAVGTPVRVQGRVQSYNGQLQMVLSLLEPAPGVDPARFLPRSPHAVADLWARFQRLVRAVGSRRLRRVLELFFEDPDFHRRFELAPAAKGAHHAYLHGLLEHTVSVGGLALKAAEHYRHLGRDLLVTGALLHDVGKVREFSLGPPIDYTDAGRLEGHLVLGVRMLDRRLARTRNFPPELARHLRHLILSHHGSLEFGSPRRPKTAEAMVLHLIDDLDAKTAMIQQAAREQPDPEARWSGYHRLLERYLYTGPVPGDQEEVPAGSPPTPGLFDS